MELELVPDFEDSPHTRKGGQKHVTFVDEIEKRPFGFRIAKPSFRAGKLMAKLLAEKQSRDVAIEMEGKQRWDTAKTAVCAAAGTQ